MERLYYDHSAIQNKIKNGKFALLRHIKFCLFVFTIDFDVHENSYHLLCFLIFLKIMLFQLNQL